MAPVKTRAGTRPEAHSVNLPRPQVGPQPQGLLVTLLGDYWFGRSEHLPSAALVGLLEEFGSTSASSRTALSRLSRRGLLDSSKRGRHTFYGLSDRAARVLADGVRRILGFGASEPPWPGTWTCVAFSVPEDQRHARHALRTKLRWLGFAPLYDGFWVSPHSPSPELDDALTELGVATATVIVGELRSGTQRTGDPILAWDIDALRATYQRFVDGFGPLRALVAAGRVDPAEALVARTQVMDTWRKMPGLDPGLPAERLPSPWPRAEARRVFVEVYDTLGPIAELRIRELIAVHAPELAPLARHFTTEFLGS